MTTDTTSRTTDLHGNPVYRVPDGANLESLYTKLEKLNKRARRLAMPEIVALQIGEEFVTRKRRLRTPIPASYGLSDATGNHPYYPAITHEEITVRLVLLTITGETPRINGWSFAAAIQHDEIGNILRTSPAFAAQIPLRYRSAPPTCDHCAKERRRTDTYVLHNETENAWKQVGRRCLQDFLRTTNPHAFAEFAEILFDLEKTFSIYEDDCSDYEHEARVSPYYSLQTLLERVNCLVRKDGWCSRTEARTAYKQSTVDSALCWFNPEWEALQTRESVANYTPTPEDQADASDAISWAQSLPPEIDSDYLWNCHVIAQKEFIDDRSTGLAGSIIAAHKRALNQSLDRKYEYLGESAHFGTPDKREVFHLRVVGLHQKEGDYGLTTIVRLKQAGTNNSAVWFASGEPKIDLEIDQIYMVKATVKKHDAWQGHAQTTLTRLAPTSTSPRRFAPNRSSTSQFWNPSWSSLNRHKGSIRKSE